MKLKLIILTIMICSKGAFSYSQNDTLYSINYILLSSGDERKTIAENRKIWVMDKNENIVNGRFKIKNDSIISIKNQNFEISSLVTISTPKRGYKILVTALGICGLINSIFAAKSLKNYKPTIPSDIIVATITGMGGIVMGILAIEAIIQLTENDQNAYNTVNKYKISLIHQ